MVASLSIAIIAEPLVAIGDRSCCQARSCTRRPRRRAWSNAGACAASHGGGSRPMSPRPCDVGRTSGWIRRRLRRAAVADAAVAVFEGVPCIAGCRSPQRSSRKSVVPQVAAAHAGQHHTHQGVGRLVDGGVGAFTDGDVLRASEDRCSHGLRLLVARSLPATQPLVAGRRETRSRQVPAGPPSLAHLLVALAPWTPGTTSASS